MAIWDLPANRPLDVMTLPDSLGAYERIGLVAAFSPDSRTLATLGVNGVGSLERHPLTCHDRHSAA